MYSKKKIEKGLDYNVFKPVEIKVILERKGGMALRSRKVINKLTVFLELLKFINYIQRPIVNLFRELLRYKALKEHIDMG